jgi:phage baseplate assembly protein W
MAEPESAGILGAGVAFPLQVDQHGGMALAHGEDHVDQAIGLILSTVPGERAMRPDFGCALHNLTFESIDAPCVARIESEVRSALDRWEPRIEVLSVDLDLSGVDERAVLVSISYRVRATGRVRTSGYRFHTAEIQEGSVRMA